MLDMNFIVHTMKTMNVTFKLADRIIIVVATYS